ncbi:MAG TPA: flavin reductase family protein [Aestuariivirga sp.]|nr:flavin reductase family protein [Aestuariivirga sp.]
MQGAEHLAETTANFIAAMGAAATGVSVVTTEGMAGRFGLTVSAISSVSAEPPMLLACVNRKSPAVAAIDRNGRFAVNVLGLNSKDVAEVFAGRPRDGKPYDFERHGWEEGATGMPVLTDATASFECEIECSQDAGSHRIFIGRVVNAKRNSAEPLVYCNRAFGRVSEL